MKFQISSMKTQILRKLNKYQGTQHKSSHNHSQISPGYIYVRDIFHLSHVSHGFEKNYAYLKA